MRQPFRAMVANGQARKIVEFLEHCFDECLSTDFLAYPLITFKRIHEKN